MNADYIYKLSEQADEILKGDDYKNKITPVSDEIKNLFEDHKKGSVGIAQIKPVVGNIEYNAKKIIKYISYASKINLDMVVFPEYALTGFPISSILDKYPFLLNESKKWLDKISELTFSTVAVIGCVEKNEDNNYSSVLAVVYDGKIQKIIRENICEPINIQGVKYLFALGDNLTGYEEYSEKYEVLIDCSYRTPNVKESVLMKESFADIAKKYNALFMSVNMSGSVDNIVFDGMSEVRDVQGVVFARAVPFQEQFLVVNPIKRLGKVYEPFGRIGKTDKKFTLDYEYDLERTYKVLIQGIRDYFRTNRLERACLGLSGGLDSTVCAVLLADALGKENVYGISMPSKITTQESKSDARLLAENLGINYTEVSIKEIFELTNGIFMNMFSDIESKWKCRYKKSYTQDNIQARTRAVYLWGIANEFSNCIPISTSDKSEAYMGYATINGDMSGGLAPIADVTKTKLFALARWLNKNREDKNVIPETIILKRPGAELAIDEKTGKPLAAEDALMPYEFMDEVIWRLENNHESYSSMLDSKFEYETKYNLSQEEKKVWLEKFYQRMAAASYKKSILPPMITVDSVLPSYIEEYSPISYKVDYKQKTSEDIKEELLKSMI